MYKKIKLKNGLRVITVPIKDAKSVTILILVGTGSKYETKEINGISHFLEHMFFKGTKKRPNTLKISETLDMIGGQYNAFTSKEITGFWAKVDKKHINVALDWIADIFLNSKLDKEEIEREKGVIIEELNMYLDTPTSYVSELFEYLLYGDQPAGWRIIGEKENILKFNREKLLEYYINHYSAENTIICAAGSINVEQFNKKVENYFSQMPPVKHLQKIDTIQKQSKPELLVHRKKTDQTHFCLGVRAYNIFDSRRYALNLLSVILGGNMSSRLFISVRERNGLGYYIHTSTDNTTDTGYLLTQAGVQNNNLEKAIKLILKEYQDLKNNKITVKELKKAKDYIRGNTSLSLDASDAQASFYATQEIIENKIMTPEERLRHIDKVSINDIKKVAEDIFQPEKLNLSVIGPLNESEEENVKKALIL